MAYDLPPGVPGERAPAPPEQIPPKGRKSKGTWIVVGVIIILILLILALLFTGVIPGVKKVVATTEATYAVTFAQTGLPGSVLWEVTCSVTVGSQTYQFGQSGAGTTTEFAVPNGTYACRVASPAPSYAPPSESMNVTVHGAAVTVPIAFALAYPVTFTESGLGTDAYWTVILNGTNYSAIGSSDLFSVVNGTYHFTVDTYGYSPSPASGSITVQGAGVARAIIFTALPQYTVRFNETGLPTRDLWGLAFSGGANGTAFASSGQSVAPLGFAFSVYPGVYQFAVSSPLGYAMSPETGNVTVSNSNVTQLVTFTAVPMYAVTFVETGLPAGTTWSVDLFSTLYPLLLNGTSAPGSNDLLVPAGTYQFTSDAVNYTASPASGALTVGTHPVTQAIAFAKTLPVRPATITVTETGLPAGSQWMLSIESNYPVNGLYGPAASLAPYGCANSTVTVGTGPSPLRCPLIDGHYTWVAWTFLANYTASPMTGGLWVNGSAANVSTSFVETSNEYLFWIGWGGFFGEGPGPFGGGLPNGTTWGVTLNGATHDTEGTAWTSLVANGAEAVYSVTAPAGFIALPSAGEVTGAASPFQSGDHYASPNVAVVFVPDSGASAAVLPVRPWGTAFFSPLLASNRGF